MPAKKLTKSSTEKSDITSTKIKSVTKGNKSPKSAGLKKKVEDTRADAQSNLHPERLSFERFSDRKKAMEDDSTSIWKLIIYVIVVIAIGVGLTLFVQKYIESQNQAQIQSEIDNLPVSSAVSDAIEISQSILPDADADPKLSAKEQYLDKDSSVSKSGESPFELVKFAYRRFESAERFILTFDSGRPEASAKLDGDGMLFFLDMQAVATDNESLKPGREYAKLNDTSVVKSVQNSSTGSDGTVLSFYLRENMLYKLSSVGDTIVLDLIQKDSVANPETDNNTPDQVDGNDEISDAFLEGQPAAPHYDNTYSKSTQFISSAYTGNKLRVWNYNYRDYGDRYEFKFRIKDDGSGVNPMKPNVKAYLGEDTSDPTLFVEIYNINWEILSNHSNAECFDNVGYGNVKKICGDFDTANNVVTYKIHLNNKADFEVDSVDNTKYDPERPGEVIWVKIKDN